MSGAPRNAVGLELAPGRVYRWTDPADGRVRAVVATFVFETTEGPMVAIYEPGRARETRRNVPGDSLERR